MSPYARAVSNTVMPASAAATIVASARSSSRSASVERRMQPRPTRSSPGLSQLSGSSRLRRRTPPIGKPRPPARVAPREAAVRTARAARGCLRTTRAPRRSRRRGTSPSPRHPGPLRIGARPRSRAAGRRGSARDCRSAAAGAPERRRLHAVVALAEGRAARALTPLGSGAAARERQRTLFVHALEHRFTRAMERQPGELGVEVLAA